MAQPALYILAGPNGSGKTTIALTDPTLRDVPFINADIEAQRLSPGSPAKAAIAAGRMTLTNIAQPRLVFETRERRTLLVQKELPGWFRTAFEIDDTIDDAAQHIERRLQNIQSGPR